MPTTLEELGGKEKAAVLLIALGPEKSAQIFKHLKEEEIEALTFQIANTTTIMPDVKEGVLNEFYQICLAQQYITEGGVTYATQILERALGETKAKEILNKLTMTIRAKPFEFIRKTDASQLLNFIQNEHPQTIALILSYLKPNQAAQIIVDLSPEKQVEVAKRIALIDRLQPDVIKTIENQLEKKLSAMSMEDTGDDIGGVDTLVEILNLVDRTAEKNIMDSLETEDIDLAEEIRRKMFVFEDITALSGRDIQLVLRQQDFDDRDLAIALKGSNEAVRNVIYANLSKRRGALIQEEMEYLGPVRRSEIEDAQQKFVSTIRRLQDSNEIIVARGGGDELIV